MIEKCNSYCKVAYLFCLQTVHRIVESDDDGANLTCTVSTTTSLFSAVGWTPLTVECMFDGFFLACISKLFELG